MYRKLRSRGKVIQTQEHDQLLDSDNDSLDSDKSCVTQEYLLEPTKARERIYLTVLVTFCMDHISSFAQPVPLLIPVGSHNCPSRDFAG